MDLDLVIDLVTATGNPITDAEASKALRAVDQDQLGASSLEDFLEWWRTRKPAKDKKSVLWRDRLINFHSACSSTLKAIASFRESVVERLKRITEEQSYEEAREAMGSGEGGAQPQGATETPEGAPAAGPQAPIPANQPAGPGATNKTAIGINIGHMKEARSTLLLEVISTSGTSAAPISAAPRGGTAKAARRPDTVGLELIEQEYAQRVKRVSKTQAAELKPMGMVLWCDLVLKPRTLDTQAAVLMEQMRKAFSTIPEDYSNPLLCRARVTTLYVGPKSNQKLIRVSFYSEKDHLSEVEDKLPMETPLSSMLKKVVVRVELGLDLFELLKLSGQFVDFERRCYGPQAEELGEKEMNPFVFNKKVRERREAALKAAEQVMSMDIPTLKGHLTTRGLSTTGNWGELRARLKEAFLLQSDRAGYGELSTFGESLVKTLCKRVDLDKDHAFNFRELIVLQRILGQVR